MNRIRATALLAILGATLAAAASAPAAQPRMLVVDRDGVQCGNADFTSIQAAVDAAQPGDRIRICPDLYAESVIVDKPLTLKADPDAVETIDCFQSTLGELPLDQQAIVDPANNGFSVAFKLVADDVVLEGFVIQGATVGVDASDRFSGYRIHHNLIRLNTLFGVDFGSSGVNESRADHNCIRDNRYGLVSELDDDSAWSATDRTNRGPENARDLTNARIDHNSTFRNTAGVEAAGPGRHDWVTFDHNVSLGDTIGIAIQNADQGRIVANDLRPTRNGILVGGATVDLLMARNLVETGQQAIVFVPATAFIDAFTTPVLRAVVTENVVTSQTLDAFLAVAGRLFQSVLENNVATGNARDGIRLGLGNSGNVVRGNVSEGNGRYGIYAQGAVQNLFETNRMLGNGVFDARDDARASNTWTANDCVTDSPAGTICGVGY